MPAVAVRELQAEELELRTKYNISDQEFEVIRSNVVRSIPHKAGVQWKFDGALFFVTTVITTIGQKYFYFYSSVTESEVNVYGPEIVRGLGRSWGFFKYFVLQLISLSASTSSEQVAHPPQFTHSWFVERLIETLLMDFRRATTVRQRRGV